MIQYNKTCGAVARESTVYSSLLFDLFFFFFVEIFVVLVGGRCVNDRCNRNQINGLFCLGNAVLLLLMVSILALNRIE